MMLCASWFGKLKENVASLPRRSWTARASSPPVMAARWVTMPANASKAASGILLVDTLGLILGGVVTPANTTERDGAKAVLLRVLAWFHLFRH